MQFATPGQCAVWYAVGSGAVPSAAYNLVWRLDLEGDLEVERIRQSLAAIVARHEPLRTTFVLEPDGLLQVVSEAGPVALEVVDLASPDARVAGPLDDVIRKIGARRLDPHGGPLTRFTLLRLARHTHVLLVVMHHLVADGVSWSRFAREFATIHDGRTLPPLPASYREFAAWQRSRLDSGEWTSARDESRRRLARSREITKRLGTRMAAANVSNRHEVFRERIPGAIASGVRDAAAACGVTPFRFLLSAFLLCIGRCVGETEVAVRTTVSGRVRPDVEDAIGFFSNAVPVQATLQPDMCARELVRQVHDEVSGAIRRGGISVDAGTKGEDGRFPTCPLGIGFTKLASPLRLSAAGLSITEQRVFLPFSPYALGAYVQDVDGETHVTYVAHDAFADRIAIQGLHDAYVGVLGALAVDPDRSLRQVVDSAGLDVSVVAGPTRDVPSHTTLHGLVEAQAVRDPAHLACVQGAVELTYGELDRAAARIDARLRRAGVRAGDFVGLCADRSPESLAALLGILKAGAAFVVLDPAFPPERRALIAVDAGVKAAIAQASFVDELRATCPVLPLSPASFGDDADANPAHEPVVPTLAYAAYTSGSSGKPKGVLGTHAGAANYLAYVADTYALGPSDVVLQLPAWSFDASIRDLIGPLTTGTVVVLPETHQTGDPEALVRLARERGVTRLLSTVPSVLASLADAGCRAAPLTWMPRTILVSGERVSGALARRVREAFGADVELVNQYGPTEATMTTTYWRVTPHWNHLGSAPAGTPLQNTRVYVLDENGSPVPRGLAGEVYIGGAGISPGYLGRPDLTAERFLPDRFAGRDGARMYRTGDRGRLVDAEGVLEFLGRLDRQVKIRGVRVEPGEVEQALRSMPGIVEAVVTVSARGDENALVAYVVLRPGVEVDMAQLTARLKEQLPGPFIPQWILPLESIPRTRNGKVDHQRLPAAPARVDAGPRGAAQTPAEARVAAIWRELLRLADVPLDASFFDLGGHSLLAATMVARVNQAFGTRLPLAALTEAPNVAALAALASARDADRSWRLLVPLQPGGAKPPIFFVHGINGQIEQFRRLASLLGSERPVYGVIGHNLTGERIPTARMETLASIYVPAIRACWPDGPYHLAGHSFGGLLAFEIARQLRDEGHAVGLVGLIDSKGRGYPAYPSRLARAAATWRGHVRAMGGFTPERAARYVRQRARLTGRRVRQDLWRIAHAGSLKAGVALPPMFDRIPDRPYYPALAAYRPGRYAGARGAVPSGDPADGLRARSVLRVDRLRWRHRRLRRAGRPPHDRDRGPRGQPGASDGACARALRGR